MKRTENILLAFTGSIIQSFIAGYGLPKNKQEIEHINHSLEKLLEKNCEIYCNMFVGNIESHKNSYIKYIHSLQNNGSYKYLKIFQS